MRSSGVPETWKLKCLIKSEIFYGSEYQNRVGEERQLWISDPHLEKGFELGITSSGGAARTRD